jgi:hypothetical protein
MSSVMQFEEESVAGDAPEPLERSAAEKAAPRQYRSHRLETPSHPGKYNPRPNVPVGCVVECTEATLRWSGGVNEDAVRAIAERAADRKQRERAAGVYNSSQAERHRESADHRRGALPRGRGEDRDDPSRRDSSRYFPVLGRTLPHFGQRFSCGWFRLTRVQRNGETVVILGGRDDCCASRLCGT